MILPTRYLVRIKYRRRTKEMGLYSGSSFHAEKSNHSTHLQYANEEDGDKKILFRYVAVSNVGGS